MHSSPAVPPTAAAANVQSPTASDSDEYEYEEIEIEEEIEVEEEVPDEDEEEEEEEKEGGEELSPAIEHRDDEKVAGKTNLIDDDDGDDDDDDDDDDKAPQTDGEMVTNPCNKSSKEVTSEDSLTAKSNKLPHSEEEFKQMTANNVNNTIQKELRLDVPLVRPRSLTPINQENKRPALICDFFSRGWCIKGQSCRFLHIRDPVAPFQKKELQDDEGAPTTTCSEPHEKIKPKSNWVSSFPKSLGEYQLGFHNHKNYTSTSWNSYSFKTFTHYGDDKDKDRTKFSTYNWEPSKPFRSSFLISQGISISSPDIQNYNPTLDSNSIEPPQKIQEKTSKFPTISSPKSDRISLASHVNSNDNNTCELTSENTKEKKGGNDDNDDVIIQEVNNHKFTLQIEEQRKETKLGFFDNGVVEESKAVRHFRSALIEFVKELLKPKWREGKLSKDAHKLIVKKAVDKVVNTLPEESIPSTQESIEIYLHEFNPKLIKLVEGYTEKYGKKSNVAVL